MRVGEGHRASAAFRPRGGRQAFDASHVCSPKFVSCHYSWESLLKSKFQIPNRQIPNRQIPKSKSQTKAKFQSHRDLAFSGFCYLVFEEGVTPPSPPTPCCQRRHLYVHSPSPKFEIPNKNQILIPKLNRRRRFLPLAPLFGLPQVGTTPAQICNRDLSLPTVISNSRIFWRSLVSKGHPRATET